MTSKQAACQYSLHVPETISLLFRFKSCMIYQSRFPCDIALSFYVCFITYIHIMINHVCHGPKFKLLPLRATSIATFHNILNLGMVLYGFK